MIDIRAIYSPVVILISSATNILMNLVFHCFFEATIFCFTLFPTSYVEKLNLFRMGFGYSDVDVISLRSIKENFHFVHFGFTTAIKF